MTAVATLAPLHCLAATLDAEVRDDATGVDGSYLAFPNDDVIVCSAKGKVRFVRCSDAASFDLGTLSDGPDVIAARFRALVEVSA